MQERAIPFVGNMPLARRLWLVDERQVPCRGWTAGGGYHLAVRADRDAAYLEAGVVGGRHRDDALHVALATVAGAEAIVSWNFRHLLRGDRVRGYHEINAALGYGCLSIVSPREVAYREAREE